MAQLVTCFISCLQMAQLITCCIFCLQSGSTSNFWFLSEFGSDDNDCRSEFTECKNLQTVLDRATDGADICVTSEMLLQRGYKKGHGTERRYYEKWKCFVNAGVSFTLRPASQQSFTIECQGDWKVVS